jgi:type I restriction enzyme R subunit
VFEELMADTDISESFNAGNTYDVLMNIVSEKMGRKLTEQIGRYYNFLEILERDNGLKMSLIQHFVNAIAQRTRAIQDFPYDPILLKERLYDKFSEDFLVLHRYGLRPLREVLDAFFQILRTTSISSLDGINDLLRDTINRYMMDEHMRLIDKRLTYNTLSSKFEAYLKKLYYLIHGEQVTTREGTTHNAQFLDAAKSFKCLCDLYYSDQPELQEFKGYYADIHNWRNVEAHNAPELSETQIDSRVYELLAMYLFVTLYSIGDLEYAGVL